MAQIVQRTWRSGPRKVKRAAWGYTAQIDSKQIRKYDAAWSREDAEKALAARLLNVAPSTGSAPEPVEITFKATGRGATSNVAASTESSASCGPCSDWRPMKSAATSRKRPE